MSDIAKKNAENQQFLNINAEFFAKSFVPVAKAFNSQSLINIISEERDMTIATSVKEPLGEDLDVDCMILVPEETISLRSTLNALSE